MWPSQLTAALKAMFKDLFNEQEYRRMLKFLPNTDLPEKTNKTRLNTLKKLWSDSTELKREGMKASGVIVPENNNTANSDNGVSRVSVVGPNGEVGDMDATDTLPPGWRRE